ncbi:hypothetical protein WMQ40_00205 [Vibrio diabolicus]|uniref:hypothetical protein n=1 Tax=Vibrio diabolicus TaxID=50719 RepID=UPI001C9D1E86|nr:hypothetical protein [Vibrio parahaemolyticus]MBY8272139.1 hypothetical protein [Vibrio fluvialis]EJG1091306.1 hypothetical protein [Vibrio parahaemolyticus]EJG1727746.1 hypothetical protein [Vibrio parahaemolyticus]HCE1242918.1 hypothetical protein [Vibrio parahaemolyticus]
MTHKLTISEAEPKFNPKNEYFLIPFHLLDKALAIFDSHSVKYDVFEYSVTCGPYDYRRIIDVIDAKDILTIIDTIHETLGTIYDLVGSISPFATATAYDELCEFYKASE